MRFSSRIQHLRERFFALLPLFYIGYALPIAVAFALVNPPFLAPDEANHFYRAIQVSEGQLYASRSPDPNATINNTSGGYICANAVYLATRPVFVQAALHIEYTFDPSIARKEHLFDLPWENKVRFIAFSNIAPYPFTSYFSSAAGIMIGRTAGLSILESFYLARLCNAFSGVILCGLAIHLISRGKVIMASILSLPTTLFLFSSLSQDALLISYTALAVGLLNSHLDTPADQQKPWVVAVILGLLVIVVAGRPPYIPFILIASQLVYFGAKPRGATLVGCGVAVVLVVLYMLSVRHLGIASLLDAHPERQAAFILQHPIKMVSLMVSTIQLTLPFTLRQFIGIFGWVTCELPDPFYTAVELMLFVVFLSDFKPGDLKLSFWPRIATLILSISVVPLVLISLFLMWNDARNYYIVGEQGRYYIPLAMMLTLMAGNQDAPWMERPFLQFMRLSGGILTLLVLVIADFAGWMVCLARFYY